MRSSASDSPKTTTFTRRQAHPRGPRCTTGHRGARQLSIHTEWAIGDFDVDELIDTAEVIDGIPFVRLEHVVAYKRIASRDKDVEHLAEYESRRL